MYCMLSIVKPLSKKKVCIVKIAIGLLSTACGHSCEQFFFFYVYVFMLLSTPIYDIIRKYLSNLFLLLLSNARLLGFCCCSIKQHKKPIPRDDIYIYFCDCSELKNLDDYFFFANSTQLPELLFHI